MSEKDAPSMSKELFLACDWHYIPDLADHHGYSSVMQSLQTIAKGKEEAGDIEQAVILNLLARAASMKIVPASTNEPFRPIFQDFQADRRSALPEDFTAEELKFFEQILDETADPWLKARLADLLWLCRKPKNIDHAKKAIEAYTSHDIEADSWQRDVDDCWERAARLCLQINDYDSLYKIKDRLFETFQQDFSNSISMQLWLAELLDRLNIDKDFRPVIAEKLFTRAKDLENTGNFDSARSYLELASKKYKQCDNQQCWLDSLVAIAECFEKEANARTTDSNMAANSFYENAIQAYRKIPVKHRANYDIENKISLVRSKITKTGKASLDEMSLISTPCIDISSTVKASIKHVSDKDNLQIALRYFSGLYPGPCYLDLRDRAQKVIQQNPLSTLFGATYMATDGRVVAKTPSVNFNVGDDDPANKAVLNHQMHQLFDIDTLLVVEGQIVPALCQLLKEHRVTRQFLEATCYHSPIVPDDRERLMAFALWLGFEHDFSNAIHLICPQLEHIIRIQLKKAGAHTSNVDVDGVENEMGLSKLMGLPEARQVFGDDLVFELKSVFTNVAGSNLRNEVAHGLLDDRSSDSIASIYAWWLVLRLIVRSFITGEKLGDK